MKYKVGFIGVGNMGGALARAVAKTGEKLAVAAKSRDEAAVFASGIGADVLTNAEIAESCKYIFLGVKPQNMGDMLDGIKQVLQKRSDRFILISMAAGLSIKTISELAGDKYPTIRIMPNTPVSVGDGMTLYAPCPIITDDEIAEFEAMMRYSGQLERMQESLIDAGCSVSGCGPAFVYMFAEALTNAGVSCGLDEATAKKLALSTLKGASTLALSSELSLEKLRQNVCSPGGSTIEGVKVFEREDLSGMTEKAVAASYKRNIELGKR